MFIRRIASIALVLLLSTAAAESPFPAHYRVVTEEDQTSWFEDARTGERFLSIGVNHIDDHDLWPPPDSIFYKAEEDPLFGGDYEAWQQDTISILKQAGFNTIGAWSDPKLNDGTLYETPILYIITAEPNRLLNLFRPGLEELMEEQARAVLEERPHPDRIIGVFLDNEMSWYGRTPWTPLPNDTLLEDVFRRAEPGDPARKTALDWLKARYDQDIQAFAQAWQVDVSSWEDINEAVLVQSRTDAALADRSAFLSQAAERFFSTATKVMDRLAPDMPLLGCRFAGLAPKEVLEIAGRYSDVVSVNNYRGRPTADTRLLARYYVTTGKPLMITEYSWRARENQSGNPNTGGAGSVVDTQAERAAAYASFVEDNLAWPMVTGMHWFEWADQSPQGRFDGENSNYGMVDIYHRPYRELQKAMASTNNRVEELHRTSDRTPPTEMPEEKAVTFEPGQYPDRPPQVSLLGVPTVMPPTTFSAGDANSEAAPTEDGKGLLLTLDTGNDWGAGVTLHGPETNASGRGAEHAVDIDGYEMLEIDLTTPEPLTIEVVLDEASVDAPGAASFDTGAGDDGESFIWETVRTKPGRQTLQLPLGDLLPRTNWGNQEGSRTVDLSALKGPALVFPGGQGQHKVTLHEVRFVK